MSEVIETREKTPVFVSNQSVVPPVRYELRVVWQWDDGWGEQSAGIHNIRLDANDDVCKEAFEDDVLLAELKDSNVTGLWHTALDVIKAFARPVLKYGPDDQTLEWITFAEALAEGMST